ncbi:MAG: hypothetical protein GY862_18535, partial [Gammaproteobacteria bacterium]|nr:hypothetical protein [Gammaproteobacteria bacterium]
MEPFLSAAVSIVAKSAAKAAQIHISKHLSKALEKALDKTQQKAAEAALQAAFEAWFDTLLKTLGMFYEEAEVQGLWLDSEYATESFLQDEKVSAELLKPLSEQGGAPDSRVLLERWNALAPQPLPEEFDLGMVLGLYQKRLNKIRAAHPKLREILLNEAALQSLEQQKSISRFWPDFDLAQYAKRIQKRYRALDISALTPPARDDVDERRILIKDVFIPQNARKSRPPRELPKELWRKLHGKGDQNTDAEDSLPAEWDQKELQRLQSGWSQAEDEAVLDALGKKQRRKTVLLGDPGSGKSTLARYLLLSLLEPPLDRDGKPQAWTRHFGGCLPLLVELRNYMAEKANSSECHNFVEYFHYLGKSEKYGLNHQELKQHLKTRPSLTVFDGLDEIFDPGMRAKITQEIIGFADFYPHARVLVTSRLSGYQGKPFLDADFEEYTLQDLNEEQIKIFAQGWFGLIFADNPVEADTRRQRILDAMQHAPAIRQLAGNPLLLTMIAIIAKHQELPRERAKLYEHAAKVLCHQWDVTGKHIGPAETPANFMCEDNKLELLRRVAWRMQAGEKGLKGNFILATDLEDEIEKYLKDRWQLKPTKAHKFSRKIIDQLRKRNFILCLWGPQIYGFVHRTFLEYFCAAHTQDCFEREQEMSFEQLRDEVFLAHCRDTVWHEVLRLICGSIAPRFAGQLIDTIVPAREQASEKNDDLILAVQCLAEVSNLNEIANTAGRVLEGVFGQFEYSSIRSSNEQRFLENAVPSIESIGKNWPGRSEQIVWLKSTNKSIASWKGIHAFGRLVAALWGYEEKTRQFLMAALEQAPKNQNRFIILLYYDALACAFAQNNATRTILLERISKDDNSNVRHAAIQALAQHYRDAPGVLPLLRERAVADKKEWPRRAAVQALAQHYRDDPGTLPLLRERAVADEDVNIRSTAVQALAEHYRDDPATLPLLRERAVADEYVNV